MARYDYECPEHGVFEVERSVHAEATPVWCPVAIPAELFGKPPKHLRGTTVQCGWEVTRLYSPPGVVIR